MADFKYLDPEVANRKAEEIADRAIREAKIDDPSGAIRNILNWAAGRGFVEGMDYGVEATKNAYNDSINNVLGERYGSK